MKKLILVPLMLLFASMASAQLNISNNINVKAPYDIDFRRAKIVDGVWTPFASVAEANAANNINYRGAGLTILINTGTGQKEYWYDGCTADSCLKLKTVTPAGSGGATASIATPTVAGIVKVGSGLSIDGTGTISTLVNQSNTLVRKRLFNVLKYGAVGDDSTENTAAFSACMADLVAAGGGVFYMPAGIYRGRIFVPSITFPNWVYIEIQGEGRPLALSGTVPSLWEPFPYSITTLKCTQTLTIEQGFATNRNAVITCAPSATNFGGFSNLYLAISNLEVRTKNDPSIHGIDAESAGQLICENVTVGTGTYSPNGVITKFTKGIITPRKNNAAWTRLANICVYGYNDGIEVGEHTDGDNITVTGNGNGLVFYDAYHTSRFGRVCAQNNIVNISIRGLHRFGIENLNIEHAVSPSTQLTQSDVNDPLNYGKGYIRYGVTKAGLGQDTTFTKVGGTGIITKLFGTP